MRNPVTIAIALALLVIAGIFAIKLREKMQDFPGSATARKLLTVASSTRSILLDPVKTDAGALGDLFFMKRRWNITMCPRNSRIFAIGCRVFDDDGAHRVAQIWVVENRMQLFSFPRREKKDGRGADWKGWRYVEQEGWTGVVQQRDRVYFMAALRGKKKDLATYLPKSQD